MMVAGHLVHVLTVPAAQCSFGERPIIPPSTKAESDSLPCPISLTAAFLSCPIMNPSHYLCCSLLPFRSGPHPPGRGIGRRGDTDKGGGLGAPVLPVVESNYTGSTGEIPNTSSNRGRRAPAREQVPAQAASTGTVLGKEHGGHERTDSSSFPGDVGSMIAFIASYATAPSPNFSIGCPSIGSGCTGAVPNAPGSVYLPTRPSSSDHRAERRDSRVWDG